MNELKTEDVMRALECCANTVCEGCPLDNLSRACLVDLPKSALALLREKDEQIFKLENRLKECENGYEGTLFLESCKLNDAERKITEKDAEIERLTKELDDARRDCAVAEQNHYECKKELATARADAITEFAEKLKESVKYIPWCDYPPVHNCIDQIAEKLKGETDEN